MRSSLASVLLATSLFLSPLAQAEKEEGWRLPRCRFSLAALLGTMAVAGLGAHLLTRGDGTPGFSVTPEELTVLNKRLSDYPDRRTLERDLEIAGKALHRFMDVKDTWVEKGRIISSKEGRMPQRLTKKYIDFFNPAELTMAREIGLVAPLESIRQDAEFRKKLTPMLGSLSFDTIEDAKLTHAYYYFFDDQRITLGHNLPKDNLDRYFQKALLIDYDQSLALVAPATPEEKRSLENYVVGNRPIVLPLHPTVNDLVDASIWKRLSGWTIWSQEAPDGRARRAEELDAWFQQQRDKVFGKPKP